MKKVLVLMLVLGIASMATAGLTITGPTTIDPLGTISLAVTADAAAAANGETAYIWIDYAGYNPGADVISNAVKSPIWAALSRC